jgi:hypothetical protein
MRIRWHTRSLLVGAVCFGALALAGAVLAAADVSGGAAPRSAQALSWNGTLDGNGVVAGQQTCSGTWQGKIALSVTGSTVSGSGAVDIGSPACSLKLPSPVIAHVDFTLSGTKESSSGVTHMTLFMHPQAVTPAGGYDPSGFLVHFGQSGAGIPLVLTPNGGAIDQMLTSSVGLSNATVTLNDHFVLKSNCDPNLLQKADSDYEQSRAYSEAGVEKLKESNTDLVKTIKDYAVDFSIEQVAEKGLVVLTDWLATHAAVLVVEVGGTVVTIGKIVYDIGSELAPAYAGIKETRNEASQDFHKSEVWSNRGQADLKAALDQGPCVGSLEDQLNKLMHEQDIESEIRKRVDSWQAAGSQDLYVVNGELLNEQAAIAAARAALTGSSRTTQAVSSRPTQATVKANATQLQTALRDVRRALVLNARARAHLTAYRRKTGGVAAQLAVLLKH